MKRDIFLEDYVEKKPKTLISLRDILKLDAFYCRNLIEKFFKQHNNMRDLLYR